MYIATILSSVCMEYVGLPWLNPLPCKVLTASDMALHGRGCGHVSVELHVVAPANV